MVDANHMRERDVPMTHTAFRTSPIAGIKNCYARLQKGKVIAMENQKTKIDQFKHSFP
jgi:hypothetical protein